MSQWSPSGDSWRWAGLLNRWLLNCWAESFTTHAESLWFEPFEQKHVEAKKGGRSTVDQDKVALKQQNNLIGRQPSRVTDGWGTHVTQGDGEGVGVGRGGWGGEEAGPQTVSPERVCHLATAASPSLSLALVHRKLLLIAPPLCSSAYIQWSCDAINQWFAMICVEWLLLLLLEEERRLPADSVWGHLGDCHCPLLVMCIYILVQ